MSHNSNVISLDDDDEDPKQNGSLEGREFSIPASEQRILTRGHCVWSGSVCFHGTVYFDASLVYWRGLKDASAVSSVLTGLGKDLACTESLSFPDARGIFEDPGNSVFVVSTINGQPSAAYKRAYQLMQTNQECIGCTLKIGAGSSTHLSRIVFVPPGPLIRRVMKGEDRAILHGVMVCVLQVKCGSD